MTNPQEDALKEEFEHWAKNQPWFNDNRCHDGYVETHTNVAFHTWLRQSAALKLAVEALEWYAKRENYYENPDAILRNTFVGEDRGKKAIDALTEIRKLGGGL